MRSGGSLTFWHNKFGEPDSSQNAPNSQGSLFFIRSPRFLPIKASWQKMSCTPCPVGPMPAADREPFDQLSFYGEPKTRINGRRNSTARAHLNCGLNDVLIPISAASGNVARQSKSRQGRHGNVVGAADS